ncbi:MAG: hypothetical protein HQM10_11700 [Candidatus Riflebacteria bacterium]|nr:hypothetical protein [Candidatus Riflebacteria bacterium]
MQQPVILGLGVFSHDSGIAILQGGKILFAAEQERFDRVKHSRAFPYEAIDAGIEFLGMSFSDIDHIVINYDTTLLLTMYISYIWRYLPKSLNMLFDRRRYENAWKSGNLRNKIISRYKCNRNLKWHSVPHHLAHAASAFYCSGFESSAILTSDALGEFDSVLMAKGEGLRINAPDRIMFPHSIGAVYSAVTDHLGFSIYEGEGKVMGLAAYGNENPIFDMSDLVKYLPDGRYEIRPEYFSFPYLPWVHENWVSKKFLNRFGKKREKKEPLLQKHADIARGLQNLADKVFVHLTHGIAKKTSEKNLCYAGGVALNGYSNTRALSDGIFEKMFIQPAANDGGTALGAALYHAHNNLGCPREQGEFSPYLGPSFSGRDCEKAFSGAGISYSQPQNLCKEAAARLARGRIMGWFRGKMEVGPRALGNRSILTDPRFAATKDHLNNAVKKRESFRPFAPVVPLHRASEFFEMPADSSPYMLLIMKVRPEWQEKLRAVTHVDGTARVQTIDRNIDPLFTSLLEEFEKLCGIPVLLNTSFNGPGEPIVCSPEEAVKTFLNTGMDDLVLESLISEISRTNR